MFKLVKIAYHKSARCQQLWIDYDIQISKGHCKIEITQQPLLYIYMVMLIFLNKKTIKFRDVWEEIKWWHHALICIMQSSLAYEIWLLQPTIARGQGEKQHN